MHLGITVESLEASMKFYRDILGFREFWRGAPDTAKTLQWVNMKVPDGDDYIEFMLFTNKPEGGDLGVKNHLCLMVPEMEKAVASLEARPARKNYKQEIVVKVGVNRKRQANLFDPDGTRVELMEPHTVDGKPAPNSQAPAPR
jgi:lactoylglutathione lyase